MQFNQMMYALFFVLLSTGCFLYAAGFAKQAKAFFIALAAAIGIGVIAGLGVMLLAMLFLDLRGEWSGIALIVFMLVGGLGAAALAFIVVLIVLLAKLKPRTGPPPLRIPAFILGGIFIALSLNDLYFITPRRHPTSRLISALTSEGVDFSVPAQKELVRRGETAVPAILKAATDNPNIGNAFILPRTLGAIPGQASSDALLAMLDNPNPQIRSEAANQLGARKDKRALEKLLQQLSDPAYDNSQKTKIINAVGEMGEPSAAPRLLAATQPPPAESDGSTDDFFYESALIRAMGALKHPQAFEFLVSLHRHPRWTVRSEAIKQLANYPCRQTVLIMIEHLDDPETRLSSEVDALLLKTVGIRSGSPDRPMPTRTLKTPRAAWQQWFDVNKDRLAEHPSFE